MKQSDIKIASDLSKKITEFQSYLTHLKRENVSINVDFKIELAVAGNNYRPVSHNISAGIKDTMRSLLIADLETQVEFMTRKIEKL